MSPTCSASETSGSALIDSMNAGVAVSCDVSAGVVPYGESPYTAIENGLPAARGDPVPATAVASPPNSAAASVTSARTFLMAVPDVAGRKSTLRLWSKCGQGLGRSGDRPAAGASSRPCLRWTYDTGTPPMVALDSGA